MVPSWTSELKFLQNLIIPFYTVCLSVWCLHSGSVGRALDSGDQRVADWSLNAGGVALCFLEQETLSVAKYWFNPGRQLPTRKKINGWDVKNQNK